MVHVLYSRLVDGAEEAYERTHRRVPRELAESLRRCGIRDWSIHRVGGHLIHLIDCDDLPAAFAALAGDPANERWQQVIGGYVAAFEPADAEGMPLAVPALWRLSDQSPASDAP